MLTRDIVLPKTMTRVLGVVLFTGLTCLGAFVRIPLPFTPVPITLQTLFVLLSGLLLGSRLGAASQLGYVALGAAGLPIFTGAGSGFAYIAGPTGGYLAGFVLASFLMGSCVRFAKDNIVFLCGLVLVGNAIILLAGALWLKVFFGYAWNYLFFAGVLPFIPGDLLKSAVALSLYKACNARG